MAYQLGVDLGTTWTAAAIHRGERTSIVSLGNRAPAIPSVVFLKDDDSVLTGEAALRRGSTEPGRLAREFKRRVGDPTPILLGGSPVSAESLMARLLRWVVDTVSESEGGRPDRIVITHPANWGPYKIDLLQQGVRLADLDNVVMTSEPEAAAIHYAAQERIEAGAVIAVYDLGGGTFDATVLRKTGTGFEILGRPEGIERLGGIDFDEAVFAHVVRTLGGALERIDPNDPTAISSVARLRQECVDAKEALSSDTEVSIPVLLPGISTDVRLTRAEFEAMVRPSLTDSIGAMRRALRSANVEPSDLSAVLLVGGSSRMPIVAQLVGAELGRPVAVDAHPKHSVALGAAILAGATASAAATAAAPAAPAAPPAPPAAPPASEVPIPGMPPAAAATRPAAMAPPTAGAGNFPPPPAGPAPTRPAGTPPSGLPAVEVPGAFQAPPARKNRTPIVIGAVAAAIVLIVVGILVFGGGDGGGEASGSTTTTADETTTTAASATTAAGVTTTVRATTTTEPVKVSPLTGRGVRLDSIELEGGVYVVRYTTEGYEPRLDPNNQDGENFHIHFWWSPTFSADQGGVNAPVAGGSWVAWDTFPGGGDGELLFNAFAPSGQANPANNRPADATQICAMVATGSHGVEDVETFDCIPIPE